jgi:hypothetical protein
MDNNRKMPTSNKNAGTGEANDNAAKEEEEYLSDDNDDFSPAAVSSDDTHNFYDYEDFADAIGPEDAEPARISIPIQKMSSAATTNGAGEIDILTIDDSSSSSSTSKAAAFTNDQVPLIPTEYSSINEAMQNFTAVFESRYGAGHPPFFQGSLPSAITAAFDTPTPMERRPLVLYIHDDRSVACNIFAQNVLCEESVSSLLKCQFVLWAWDVTQEENREKLIDWTKTLNMSDLTMLLKRNTGLQRHNQFPLLLVLDRERSTSPIEVIATVRGQDSVTQVIGQLMSALDHSIEIKKREEAEERERMEREEIRREQVEAYEQSLAADRAKQELLEMERQREENERREQELLEEKRLRNQRKLAESLPSEPVADDATAIMLRVRLPSGEQQMRRFRMTEQLRWLITWVESLGYDMEHYQMWTPEKKNVASFDYSKSFAELKWSRREQITVDEKQ